jgi:hypothetical protein
VFSIFQLDEQEKSSSGKISLHSIIEAAVFEQSFIPSAKIANSSNSVEAPQVAKLIRACVFSFTFWMSFLIKKTRQVLSPMAYDS